MDYTNYLDMVGTASSAFKFVSEVAMGTFSGFYNGTYTLVSLGRDVTTMCNDYLDTNIDPSKIQMLGKMAMMSNVNALAKLTSYKTEWSWNTVLGVAAMI